MVQMILRDFTPCEKDSFLVVCHDTDIGTVCSPIVHGMFQSTAGPTKLVRDMLKTVHVLVMYVTIQAVLSFRARQCIHIRLRKHYKLPLFTSFTFLTFLPLSRLVPLFTSFLFSVVILAQVVCLHSCVVFPTFFGASFGLHLFFRGEFRAGSIRLSVASTVEWKIPGSNLGGHRYFS